MDKLSKVDTIVFDKTGTLTKGKPEVAEIALQFKCKIKNRPFRI